MSKQHKENILEEIIAILRYRCVKNSEFYYMLMKEKEKLEGRLENKKLRHEKKPKSDSLKTEVSMNQNGKVNDGKNLKSKQDKLHQHPSKQRTKISPANDQYISGKSEREKTTEFPDQRYRRKSEHSRRYSKKDESRKDKTTMNIAKAENDLRITFSQKETNKVKTKPHQSTHNSNDISGIRNAKANEHQSVKPVNNNNKIERSNSPKTFTKEEIEQMASHHKKKRPVYMAPLTQTLSNLEKVTAENRRLKTLPIMDQWSMKLERKNPTTDQTPSNCEGNLQISFIKEGSKQPHRMGSVLSPSLLKLKELKKESNKKSTKSEDSVQETKKSPKPIRLIQKQKSLPEKTSKEQIYDVEKSDLARNSSHNEHKEITSQNGTKLMKGKVVFTLDMDDIGHNEKENQTFFRRKMFRGKITKSTTKTLQTEDEAFSKTLQTGSPSIPGLLKSQTIQSTASSISVSTQTDTRIVETVGTQCSSPPKKDFSSQTPEPSREADARGSRPRVNLDDLVQRRKQRRAKSVINRKSQDEQVSGQLKRSATMEIKNKDKMEETELKTNRSIKAYNWSQTEKFVKVIVSHNGVHLLPTSHIKVESNGFNLKLLIKEIEAHSKANSNRNNNICEVVSYILNLARLCHPVVHLSYTIQPDMLTVLLRKKSEKHWNDLEISKPDNSIITAAHVYL